MYFPPLLTLTAFPISMTVELRGRRWSLPRVGVLPVVGEAWRSFWKRLGSSYSWSGVRPTMPIRGDEQQRRAGETRAS